MDFIETIFLIAFVVCVLLFLYKTFNLITFGRLASVEAVVLSFVAFLVSFGVAFVVILHDLGTNLIFNTLFTFLSWITGAFVLLFVVELIINFRSTFEEGTGAYNALERRKRGF